MSVYGTKLVRASILILITCLYGCTSSDTVNQEDYQEIEENIDNIDNIESDFFGDEGTISDDSSTDLPHPASPTAWNTKSHLMSHPRPPQEKLDNCMGEMEQLATEVKNPRALIQSTKKIAVEVRRFKFLYHWCFYNMIVVLDNKLLNDGLGLLLDERTKNFQNTMKTLWMLARSLDSGNQDKPYFRYLRLRYIQLSRDFFGRHLEFYGKDMKHNKVKKSSGEFEDE